MFGQLFVVRVLLPYENAVYCNYCLVFLLAMYAQRRPVTHKVHLQGLFRSFWILVLGVLLIISFANVSQQRPDLHPFRAYSERFRWYFVDFVILAAFLVDAFAITEDVFQSPLGRERAGLSASDRFQTSMSDQCRMSDAAQSMSQ